MLVVGAAAALFVPAFAMLVIADGGWVATTGEALLVPVHLLVIIFGFSILPGGWTERRSAIGRDDGQDLDTTQAHPPGERWTSKAE